MIHWTPEDRIIKVGFNFYITWRWARIVFCWYDNATHIMTSRYFRLRWMIGNKFKPLLVWNVKDEWNVISEYIKLHEYCVLYKEVFFDNMPQKEFLLNEGKSVYMSPKRKKEKYCVKL